MRIANEVLMQLRSGRKTQNTISIQEPIDCDKDGNSFTINDITADNLFLDEEFESKEEKEKLYKAVNTLSGRERQIIILRYGLTNQKPLTQQEVADILKISRSYVSRLEKKALEKLHQTLNI